MILSKNLDQARMEIKFVSESVNLHDIIGWIKHNPANFSVSFPDRQVNNVYFDNHNLWAFKENLTGISNRTKIRYRWYGVSSMPAPGKLEVKQKRNVYGWKQQFDISRAPYEKNASWKKIQRLILEQLDDVAKPWLLGSPNAAMINRYQRRYFESADKKIRVTVDTNQQVWGQLDRIRPNIKFETKLPDTVVVEFKFGKKEVIKASRAMEGLPCRASKNSKYVNSLIYGLVG